MLGRKLSLGFSFYEKSAHPSILVMIFQPVARIITQHIKDLIF